MIHPTAIIALALCIYAASTDVKRLEIDNWVSVAIAALFVVYGVMEPGVNWVAHVVVMLVMFVMGFVLNRTGVMGGGDVKLLTALSLWAGLSGLPTMLMVTSLAGAVVALATLSMRHITFTAPTGYAWIDGARDGKPHVAYGIAIAVGAAFMFPLIGR